MTEPQLQTIARTMLAWHKTQSTIMGTLCLLLEIEAGKQEHRPVKMKLLQMAEQLEGFVASADEARAIWAKELGME